MTPRIGPLVDVSWLADRLGSPDVRVVDCRWYLEDPAGGRSAYEAGHIPGARYVPLEPDMTALSGPGRHPLPGMDDFAERLGATGIGDDHAVVAYDDRGGAIASRLWWMMRSLGHRSTAVLDGGWIAWVAQRLPVEIEVPDWPPATLTVSATGRTVDRSELAGKLGDVKLVDARAGERYRGESEPIDPVAGHIPTAVSLPFTENLDASHRFLPAEQLRRRFAAVGILPTDDVVVYCGSGVTACHDILAIEAAGFPTPALYPGSWSDWSQHGPVAVGPEAGAPI